MQQTGLSRIKAQRLEHGWTLRELSERCAAEGVKISFSQLGKIERGLYTPYPRTRAVLARLLDLDIDEFEATA